jgi:hypothetical protein
MTYVSSYVTGSNDAILNEVGRTTAVSLVGAHLDQEVHRDTSSWSRWAMTVSGSGLI